MPNIASANATAMVLQTNKGSSEYVVNIHFDSPPFNFWLLGELVDLGPETLEV
jgi:hypothetical protein